MKLTEIEQKVEQRRTKLASLSGKREILLERKKEIETQMKALGVTPETIKEEIEVRNKKVAAFEEKATAFLTELEIREKELADGLNDDVSEIGL